MSLSTAERLPMEETVAAPAEEERPLRQFMAEMAQSWTAMLGLVLLVLLAGMAFFAPWIAAQNPYDLGSLSIMDGQLRPGTVGDAGFTYWLGTDDQGRDMLSAIMYGLRTSLLVGAGSALIAGIVGTSLGLVAANV